MAALFPLHSLHACDVPVRCHHRTLAGPSPRTVPCGGFYITSAFLARPALESHSAFRFIPRWTILRMDNSAYCIFIINRVGFSVPICCTRSAQPLPATRCNQRCAPWKE